MTSLGALRLPRSALRGCIPEMSSELWLSMGGGNDMAWAAGRDQGREAVFSPIKGFVSSLTSSGSSKNCFKP